MNHLSYLPLELQVKIFGQLTTQEKGRCASVCRAWRQTLYLPEFWRDVTFTLPHPADAPYFTGTCDSLVTRDVRSVDLQIEDDDGIEFARVLTRRVTNLQTLHLDCWHSFKVIVASDLGMKIHVHHDIFTIREVKLVTRHLVQLVRLDLLNVVVTDDTLRLISRRLAKLEHLEVGICISLTDDGIGHLAGWCGQVAGVPRLRNLLVECSPQLTDLSLMYLAKGQPLLEHLILTEARKLSDAGVELLSTLANLKGVLLPRDQNIRFSFD